MRVFFFVTTLMLSCNNPQVLRMDNDAEEALSAALITAAHNGHEAVINTLLAQGAAINQEANNGRTPLSLAVRGGHALATGALIARGADIATVRNHDARSLLAIVGRNGHSDAVAEALITLSRE